MNLKNSTLSEKPDEFFPRMNDWEGALGIFWNKTNKQHLERRKGRHSDVYICQKRLKLYALHVWELYFIFKKLTQILRALEECKDSRNSMTKDNREESKKENKIKKRNFRRYIESQNSTNTK